MNINRLPDSWGQAGRRCWWCYPTAEQAYESHPGKWRRNSAAGAEAVGSGARPPAGTAVQPAHSAGLSELDTALHPGQRQALFGVDGPSRASGLFHPLGDPGTGSAGTQNRALAAQLFLSRNALRIDGHHMSDEIPGFHNLESWHPSAHHVVTTPNATNEKTAQCAVFSSHHLPTHQGRRASASTSLALGSRSCLVTANGPMLSIGTATITEEITTITAPIMCVSARPSIDSPP